MVRTYAMSWRELRADLMLAQNIQALLLARKTDASALAMWCGHRPPWISKIISNERGMQVKELGKVADFFGLSVAQLFQHGISPLLERRRAERRSGTDRRRPENKDRRKPFDPERVHHSVRPSFPEHAADSDDET